MAPEISAAAPATQKEKVLVRISRKTTFGIIGALAVAVAGCGRAPQSPQETAIALSKPQTPATGVLSRSLTEKDVVTFLRTVRQMPRQQAPAFTVTEIPRLQYSSRLRGETDRYRETVRSALDVKRQGRDWSRDAALREAFARAEIDPAEFAALTLRISCAWSAATFSRDQPLQQVRERLDQQIETLLTEMPGHSQSSWQQDRQLRSLEEAIACSEYVGLLAQVPDASLRTVSLFREELEDCLAPSPNAAGSRRLLKESGTIQQAGFETR